MINSHLLQMSDVYPLINYYKKGNLIHQPLNMIHIYII